MATREFTPENATLTESGIIFPRKWTRWRMSGNALVMDQAQLAVPPVMDATLQTWRTFTSHPFAS